MYYVYTFQCEALDRFDVGVADDLDQRIREHSLMLAESSGSPPPPVRVYSEAYATRAEAEERELRVKAWDRAVMIEALDH